MQRTSLKHTLWICAKYVDLGYTCNHNDDHNHDHNDDFDNHNGSADHYYNDHRSADTWPADEPYR